MSISLDFRPDVEEAMSYREFDADDEIWGYSPGVTWFQFPVESVVDGIELIRRLSEGGLEVAVLGLAMDLDCAVENARSGNDCEVGLMERPFKPHCIRFNCCHLVKRDELGCHRRSRGASVGGQSILRKGGDIHTDLRTETTGAYGS